MCGISTPNRGPERGSSLPLPPSRALWRLWHLLSGRVTTHLKEGTAGNAEGSGHRWALSLPSGNTNRPAGVGATRLYGKEPCEKGAWGPWTEPQGGSSALRPWGWDPSEGMRTRSAVLLCTSAAGKHKTQAWATCVPGRAWGHACVPSPSPLVCHFPSHSCFHSYHTVRGLVSE